MKNVDVYLFRKGLEESKFKYPTITYAIKKNHRRTEVEIKDMEKAIEPGEEMKKYQEALKEMNEKHSKDKKGKLKYKITTNPITEKPQQSYDVKGLNDDESPYNNEKDKLDLKFKKVIEEQTKIEKQYNEEFLKEKSLFKLHKLKLSLFIEQKEDIPQPIMDKIHFMIINDLPELDELGEPESWFDDEEEKEEVVEEPKEKKEPEKK